MHTLFALLATLRLFVFGPEAVPQTVVEAAKRPGVTATVSISQQRMYVVVVDKMGFKKTVTWRVSTGREGFETPTGTFTPTRIAENYRSKTYNNAPMPHAVFFTGGYAVHATQAIGWLGEPASHGCVRLAPADAATFYALVEQAGLSRTRIAITS
jgi:lipoprotein-anchoring transpeptidase ErfK/SrfK